MYISNIESDEINIKNSVVLYTFRHKCSITGIQSSDSSNANSINTLYDTSWRYF